MRQLGNRGCSRDTTFTVSRIRRLTETGSNPVGLVRIQQIAANLGRLTEANRQHAGRGRVEATRMPRFFCLQQALDPLQCMIGRHARGLVQQQYAADGFRTIRATRLLHGAHSGLPAVTGGVLDQTGNFRPMRDAIVVLESQFRHVPDLQFLAELSSQESPCTF